MEDRPREAWADACAEIREHFTSSDTHIHSDMDETDRELVERARRGDGSAIAVLFSRYWRAARASAFAVTGDVASAEDAAAEGFRQAWTGLDSLRDP